MNLTKNEIEIIKLLLTSNNFISSYDIATATGINRRMVRVEMTSVKNKLKSLGYELISKPSNGYLIMHQSSESSKLLAKTIQDVERKREYALPTLPWERKNYIVKRLIDENDYMKIDDLADELLISRSTVCNDIKGAKENISKYNLSFKQKPNYGICIIGDEVDKRKPLCDYIFANLTESEMHYDYLTNFISQKDSLEYKFSGRRVQRGLYKTNRQYEFNADVNGALNILKKRMRAKTKLRFILHLQKEKRLFLRNLEKNYTRKKHLMKI